MSERLKPCPICGEELVFREEKYHDEVIYTAHCHLPCMFTYEDDGSLEDFLRRVNRRTPDIVTCGECKHYEKSTMKCFKPVDDEHTFYDHAASIWKPDDFCSYGQRRESEDKK